MISIQNIKFGYDSHQAVLDDFSLDFGQGGVYGLLGKNGTGKSTLLYLMMGLLRPQKGSITIDGTSASLRTPEVLSEMFLVPEEYDLSCPRSTTCRPSLSGSTSAPSSPSIRDSAKKSSRSASRTSR